MNLPRVRTYRRDNYRGIQYEEGFTVEWPVPLLRESLLYWLLRGCGR